MSDLALRPSTLSRELSSFDDQITLFKAKVLMDQKECTKIETAILQDLKPIVLETFGYSQIHTFGSMQSGLALRGGDLDLSVETGYNPVPVSTSSQYQNRRKVTSLAMKLRIDRKFSNVEGVPSAKVPIVRMVHLPTKTKCDVSFGTSFNIERGHLLQFYLNLHPRFFDVMLVIKMWAKRQGICDGRLFIGSYAWTLLFICYLQTLTDLNGTKIVPSVYEMQANSIRSKIVQGCRVDFNPTSRRVILPNESKFSCLGLLSGFFGYYQNFSFKNNILCPFLGTPVSRSSTAPLEWLLQESIHIINLRANAAQESSYRYFCFIQDPFEHKHFLVCRSENFSTVTQRIARSAELCKRYALGQPNVPSTFLETLIS